MTAALVRLLFGVVYVCTPACTGIGWAFLMSVFHVAAGPLLPASSPWWYAVGALNAFAMCRIEHIHTVQQRRVGGRWRMGLAALAVVNAGVAYAEWLGGFSSRFAAGYSAARTFTILGGLALSVLFDRELSRAHLTLAVQWKGRASLWATKSLKRCS